MLNKGPYIVDALRSLDDILRRMETHQAKKRSMMRSLKLASNYRAKPHTGGPSLVKVHAAGNKKLRFLTKERTLNSYKAVSNGTSVHRKRGTKAA